MPISMDRVILAPSVSLATKTKFVIPALDGILEQIGAEEIAETPGTPLNDIIGRLNETGETFSGSGDDIAEFAGRQCYRSWRKGRQTDEYIRNIVAERHGSVFEHANVGFQITGVSRSFSHELIRHSVGTGVSQESQRYVDAKDLMFVAPPLLAYHVAGMSEEEAASDPEMIDFREACGYALEKYQSLQARFVERLKAAENAGMTEKALTSFKKRANEAARALLPNAAETRMVYTTNLRALRHIILSRANEYADLEIRRVTVDMFRCAREYSPHYFDDMIDVMGGDNLPVVTSAYGRV